MRTIKFRAFDDGKMIYENDILHIRNEDNLVLRLARFWCNIRNDSQIMQFTGLHDKNGKEIYEGDILAFELTKNFNPVYEMPFAMEWDNDNAAWVNFSPKEKIVVIGNIHETPELLNERV